MLQFQPMSDYNLGWLCAAFDGEGSILLSPQWDKRCQSFYIKPEFEIENTSKEFIDKAEYCLNSLGFPSKLLCRTFSRSKKYSSTKKTVHTGHKGYYRLYINKKNVVKSLLDLIHPHLTARVIQTDIVLEFLRKSTLVVQYRPTKEDVYLIQKLRNISQRVFKLDLWLSRVDIVASKKGNR